MAAEPCPARPAGRAGLAGTTTFSSYTTRRDATKVLGELKRGIGLAAHDVGIGAFVYLRRVFEHLIEEAHQVAKAADGWDENSYLAARVLERIQKLSSYLPAFLVANPPIYSLLSKGIHELTEAECLEHFEPLRLAIEIILDESIQRKIASEKQERAKAALESSIRRVNSNDA